MSTLSTLEVPLDSPYARQYRGNTVIGVACLFIILQFTAVGLRFLSRRLNKTPHGLDDTFIYLGLVFCLGTDALAICKNSQVVAMI